MLFPVEREGRDTMQRYLDTPIAKSIKNLQAYVLVFRKDRGVQVSVIEK